ncbi:uridine kinase URK1 [Sugiyamaella lignohabitans]|uniref:Uridine kinase URK1 n=1 Tax=Sugiyamaella lignohabitans TaxID=796027 RepID=A0A167FIE7_9ASCO|nr:uridine kinase URK1 [Sugiyamaella lignohabitans]ANB15338.1 uridine kinase URK1 [Sugiyamaella lignohabitans]
MALPPCMDLKPTGGTGSISKESQEDLNNCHVLLVDSQISSGAAFTMAVAILTDHGIKQENISCVSYIASEIGLRRLSYAHPKVKIVVGKVEKDVKNHYIDSLYYRT